MRSISSSELPIASRTRSTCWLRAKGAMKARYVATGSRADIDHVVAELHDEMSDIDSAVRRARRGSLR